MDQDDTTLAPSAGPVPPDLEPKYRILGAVGVGGMGAVYRAQHRALERVRAVKVLRRELIGEDSGCFERFRREAMITSDLSHPNVVRVFDFDFAADGSPYIAMELLDGEDLHGVIRREGALGLERTVALLTGVAEALDQVHALGIVHRDLKPANLFLTADGTVKILDFGISRVDWDGAALTGTGDILGTPLYMAPEQLRGEGVDARTDIYALAAVAYEMVTGRRAVEATNPSMAVAEILGGAPRPASDHVADLPRHAVEALSRGMAKSPDGRFPTAGAFVDALAGKAGAPSRAQARREPARLIVALAAGLFVAAAVGLLLWRWSGVTDADGELPRPSGEAETATPRPPVSYREKQLTALPLERGMMSGCVFPGGEELVWVDEEGAWHQPGAGRAPVKVDWEGSADGLYVTDCFPDGRRVLGLVPRGKSYELRALDTSGGAGATLAGEVLGARLSSDGRWVAFWDRSAVRWTDVAGKGAERTVTAYRRSGGGDLPSCVPSPDGRFVGCIFHDLMVSRLLTMSVEGSTQHVVLESARLPQTGSKLFLSWPSPDRLLYGLSRVPEATPGCELWEQFLDVDARPEGEARLLGSWDGAAITPAGPSAGGQLGVMKWEFPMDVVLADLGPLSGGAEAREARRLTFDERMDRPCGWTAGGDVLFMSDRLGDWDVFAQSSADREPRLVVGGPGWQTWPQEVPGMGVAYWHLDVEGHRTNGKADLMLLPSGGTEARLVATFPAEREVNRATRPPPGQVHLRCAPRIPGRCVLARHRADGTIFSWIDLATGRVGDPFHEELWRVYQTWSVDHDGRRLAIAGEMSNHVRLLDIEEGGLREFTVARTGEIQYVAWHPDGERLVITGAAESTLPDWTEVLLLDTSVATPAGSPVALYRSRSVWHGQPAVSPDGNSLALLAIGTKANLWVLTERNAESDAPGPPD